MTHEDGMKKLNAADPDILYEVLLKLGPDLCVPIERQTIAGKTVHSVGGGVLLACLPDDIAKTNLAAILDQHGLTKVRSL